MSKQTLIILAVIGLALLAFGKSVIASVWQLLVFVAFVFGVIRSFQAHWILGVVSLLVSPIGFVVGVGCLITGRNIGHDIVNMFR